MNTQHTTLKHDLQLFSGSENIYSLPILGTKYTEGILYLVNKANCFWLLLDASGIAKSLLDKSYFITIDFKRLNKENQETTGKEATINYGDGNDTILESHSYNYTDFPLDELRLFFIDGTLMLPSEY
ncbi:DUF6876 family protein [Polaribacter sp. 20A6]|uniref:DUF6876 family protein n=1 Tax=Polaribacter sp. 20A6 TaxID=2687289 RepID=UPI0013FE3C5F|nr:DUF6876 family protein [Polaribacter sp. 20A6]